MKKVDLASTGRKKLKTGISVLAQAVGSTLGPKGRFVILESGMTPRATKDGVSVAKEIELVDKVENLGAQLVKQAAQKTVDMAGDGTTTSTILADYLIQNGLDMIEKDDKLNAVDLKRGMIRAVEIVNKALEDIREDIGEDIEKIYNIANISSNGDTEIARFIKEAYSKIGKTGIIEVENSQNEKTYIEVILGMRYDKGYLSPYFINTPGNGTCEYDNCRILCVEGKIEVYDKEFRTLLALIVNEVKQPLLIIADDVTGMALAYLAQNPQLRVCAVKAPAMGERRTHMLKDIAILTGATVIDPKFTSFEDIKEADLGTVAKVIITREDTTLLGGHGNPEEIKERAKSIEDRLSRDEKNNDYDKEKLQERLANLSKGVAVIFAGGNTEAEIEERKDRIDDSLKATRAAIEEGIVPGGGSAFIGCLSDIKKFTETEEFINADNGFKHGIKLVAAMLYAPFYVMCLNAGENYKDLKEKIDSAIEGDKNMGYDFNSRKIVNMIDEGIIDPFKVTRIALDNAASIAGVIIMTNAMVYNPKWEKKIIEENTEYLESVAESLWGDGLQGLKD